MFMFLCFVVLEFAWKAHCWIFFGYHPRSPPSPQEFLLEFTDTTEIIRTFQVESSYSCCRNVITRMHNNTRANNEPLIAGSETSKRLHFRQKAWWNAFQKEPLRCSQKVTVGVGWWSACRRLCPFSGFGQANLWRSNWLYHQVATYWSLIFFHLLSSSCTSSEFGHGFAVLAFYGLHVLLKEAFLACGHGGCGEDI